MAPDDASYLTRGSALNQQPSASEPLVHFARKRSLHHTHSTFTSQAQKFYGFTDSPEQPFRCSDEKHQNIGIISTLIEETIQMKSDFGLMLIYVNIFKKEQVSFVHYSQSLFFN